MSRIRREQFLAERSPRRGGGNPERMNVGLWEWLVETGDAAHTVNAQFDGPSAREAGPGWCFQRMGCPTTALPDGRVLRIAGEHEDSYDPDFYIYNDVIVRHPDGRVEIYGYPESVFPPTDFHSATYDAKRDCVWIIGSLGYPDHRRPGTTPVFRLDLSTFAIEAAPVRGTGPGWIHSHEAQLSAEGDALVLRRGIYEDHDGEHVDNIDDWSLALATGEWSRLTERPYQQWSVERDDGAPLMLFEMGNHAFELSYPEIRKQREASPQLSDLGSLGIELDPAKRLAAAGMQFDPEVFADRYAPPVEFTVEDGAEDLLDGISSLDDIDIDAFENATENATEEATEEANDTYADNTRYDDRRLRVGAAIVRYIETDTAVEIRIEGELDADVVNRICSDMQTKLSRLQGVDCAARLVRSQP